MAFTEDELQDFRNDALYLQELQGGDQNALASIQELQAADLLKATGTGFSSSERDQLKQAASDYNRLYPERITQVSRRGFGGAVQPGQTQLVNQKQQAAPQTEQKGAASTRVSRMKDQIQANINRGRKGLLGNGA